MLITPFYLAQRLRVSGVVSLPHLDVGLNDMVNTNLPFSLFVGG